MAPTATPPTTPEPLLQLRDEEPQRPTLRLAGETYQFRLRSDLSLEALARANRIGQRMQSVTGEDPDAMAQVGVELREVVKVAMLDMPDDVIATLTDGECLAIIEAFTNALPKDEATPAAPTANSQTTSPASAASTPAPPPET